MSGAGAIGVTAQESTVSDGPTADFDMTPGKQVPDEDVTFDGSPSTAPSGEIVDYEWDYERASYSDGSAYGSEFSYEFDMYGEYDITLTVEDSNGNSDSVTKTVEITGDGPTANFTITPDGQVPDEDVTFDSTPSEAPSGEIVDYEWDYERASYSDGSAYGSEFSYGFETYGEYDVTLTVEDNGGKSDSITKTVKITGDGPTADFSITPQSQVPDEDVTFDGSPSTAPSGEIVDYEWDYERASYSDGTAYGSEFSYEFDTYGEYDVTLTVEDNGGETDSITKTVDITGDGPTAAFEITPTEPLPDEDVTFDGSPSTAPSGEIVDYEWNYERASYSDGSAYGSEFSHEFDTYGEYDVTLTVEDNGGESDSITKTVEIAGDGPTAAFELSPEQPDLEETVTFDASSATAPGGEIVDYEWEYEQASYSDGSTSGSTFSHEFGAYGEYDVTLTITDNGGLSDTITKTVSVDGDGPTAKLEYAPENPDLDDRVVFDASGSETTSGEIVRYQWYVNGHQQRGANEKTFSGTFSEYGRYNIEVEVENSGGKSHRTVRTVTVGQAEDLVDNPEFSLDRSAPEETPVSISRGEEMLFRSEIQSETLPNATARLLVDGSPVSDFEVEKSTIRANHRFNESGTYTVEQEVFDAAGQVDTTEWTVQVSPFNANPQINDYSTVDQMTVGDPSELLSFSVLNPAVNSQPVTVEIVSELPDGVTLTGSQDVSSASAGTQSLVGTVDPGTQESMRLGLAVTDESLVDHTVSVDYTVRYYPEGTPAESFAERSDTVDIRIKDPSQETQIESEQGTSNDSTPGFSIGLTLLSLLVGIVVSKYHPKT